MLASGCVLTVTALYRQSLVSPPKAHGFGSRIVTQSLKSLSGSIAPTFAPEGLHCAIRLRV